VIQRRELLTTPSLRYPTTWQLLVVPLQFEVGYGCVGGVSSCELSPLPPSSPLGAKKTRLRDSAVVLLFP
jgi:hypothetical protein